MSGVAVEAMGVALEATVVVVAATCRDAAPHPAHTTMAAAAIASEPDRRRDAGRVAWLLIRTTLKLGTESRRHRWRARVAAGTLAGALALAACGGATPTAAPPSTTTSTDLPVRSAASTTAPSTTAVSSTTASTAPTTTVAPPTTTAAPPPFTATAATITAADVPHSWRPGCPVGPAELRLLHMTYWGFDARAHQGAMVVNASVVGAVEIIFRTLYEERFPIYEMVPVDAYGGNDNSAALADDTSGFNCRYAVAPGPPQWSAHAYGEAIDVNDVQNPYVEGGTIIPPTGYLFLNRSEVRPGMAVPGGQLVKAFASVGWQWGGRWTASPDYQHFSSTGG